MLNVQTQVCFKENNKNISKIKFLRVFTQLYCTWHFKSCYKQDLKVLFHRKVSICCGLSFQTHKGPLQSATFAGQ